MEHDLGRQGIYNNDATSQGAGGMYRKPASINGIVGFEPHAARILMNSGWQLWVCQFVTVSPVAIRRYRK
jgi:hypothetical protein